MKTNPDDFVFGGNGHHLTKRELFAIEIMSQLAGNPNISSPVTSRAKWSVEAADILIAALNGEEDGPKSNS